ncbi:MAG: helix-turn-helix transcriptional regulator [Bacteroides nordii]
MEPLTQCEYQVANEVAKGHTPVEIADVLQKSVWTIKAQIRDIHKKLGINNNVELTLFLLCDRAKRDFDLKEIRKHGLEIFFSILFLAVQITCNYFDMRRISFSSRTRVVTSIRIMGRRSIDFDLSNSLLIS